MSFQRTTSIDVRKSGIDSEPLDVSHPAADTAAVVTYAASVDAKHVITGIAWSYDDNPTNGNLEITMNGVTIFSIDITTSGPGFIPFSPPKKFSRGHQVIVTLAAAGAGVSGKLNVFNHWIN